MKKIITIMLLTLALNSQAFFNNNNSPWGSFCGNNTPWGGFNNYMEDNGIFGFNPYEYTDPQWYPQEMSNLVNEFDDDFGSNSWGNNNRNRYYNP